MQQIQTDMQCIKRDIDEIRREIQTLRLEMVSEIGKLRIQVNNGFFYLQRELVEFRKYQVEENRT
jgi:CII-binding regulator of phage lambda lysogenization HflD